MQARSTAKRARRAVAVGFVVGALAAIAAAGPGATASKPNPCKLLKTSEIESEFGASVSSGPTKGLSTAASVQCDWEVDASASLPAGAVSASVMFVNGDVAYKGLKKETSAYTPVAGLKNSLWQESTGALMVLDGKNLVTVQGVFLATSPIRAVNVQEHLIPLIEIATKRV